uniref:Uncharacterized protein n=1 Tax=Romanomermis culicivorax TaxID=13658 RepID=A0A915IPV0_ROMCU
MIVAEKTKKEEHAAKRYQQMKNNQTDKKTKKESTDKSSKFQFFKKSSKRKNNNDRKPKTNKRRLNIEDIVMSDFSSIKDATSPLCPPMLKNDHLQQNESKIRRHSSSSGEKRVTFNKSKNVGRKKTKTATKIVPLYRSRVVRSASENEDFLDDEVFSANYHSAHYGHRRRNAYEFSEEEFGSFKKYPWNIMEQSKSGSRRENAEDFDPIMIKTCQPSKQKIDDQQSKASTSRELSLPNANDHVPHLHKNIRESRS